jgi:hypothetical protein
MGWRRLGWAVRRPVVPAVLSTNVPRELPPLYVPMGEFSGQTPKTPAYHKGSETDGGVLALAGLKALGGLWLTFFFLSLAFSLKLKTFRGCAFS